MLHAAIRQTLFSENILEGIRQSLTMPKFPDIRYGIAQRQRRKRTTFL